MARHNSDDMDWEPTDDAESDQDFDPADCSECESEDPFWELDEHDAKETIKKSLGEDADIDINDIDIDIENILDPLPNSITQNEPKRKHEKSDTTAQDSPKRKRQKPNTTPQRRAKTKHKKSDITTQYEPDPKPKHQKTRSYNPEDMVKELIDATKFWTPEQGKYHHFPQGGAKWDLTEVYLVGLRGIDQWLRWRKEVARQLDRMRFEGMEIEAYDDSRKFIIFSISPLSTRMKYARDNTAPAPQFSPDRKRFVKISLRTKISVSDLATLPADIKDEAEFMAAFLRHHGYNIEEVHAFFLHVASCKQAREFVRLWGKGNEISNWDSVKKSAGFQEGKFDYIFSFLHDTRFRPREKNPVKAMMTSWAAKGWDTYDIWKETSPKADSPPKGVSYGAQRLSKGDYKGLTPVVFRVDYRSEKHIFRSTSTLEPSFPSKNKKYRFWVSSARRIDNKHDTETYYVAFAKSPADADIKNMKDALTAALPWTVTSVSAKQGEVPKSDAFDRFGRIHPKFQPILESLFTSISGSQPSPKKIPLHSPFKGTKTKDAGGLLVILLRVSKGHYAFSSPHQQLRQILSKLPEDPDIREGKVSSILVMFERESSYTNTWDKREVCGKIKDRAAGRLVHLRTARPTRGTRQVRDLAKIQTNVATWRTLGVAGNQWVDCFDPKRQDEVKDCISKESSHLDHTLHVSSRDRAMKRFTALQACKPDSEDIEMLEKFALAQLPKDHPVQTVTRSSPFRAQGSAGRAKERLATQKRHELHQQFLRNFAPEAKEICLMNTTAYTNSEENEVSKVLEEAKDRTTFLFTAVDRVAHTHERWQEVKKVAKRKGHTVMVLFLHGKKPLPGSSVFHNLQDYTTEAAKWDKFMKERTKSDNIYGLIQPTVVIAPGRKIHKDVERLIQRSFEVSEAFVQAKQHTRNATQAAFPGVTATIADRNVRWDATLPVLKQAVEHLTDLPGGLVEADEVAPNRMGKECKCGTKCFDTCSCLRYGCHPLPSLCGHRDEHGQLRPRVSLASPNCIKCTQEQSPCRMGCQDADNQAIPALAKGLCKKCLEELPCINGADCEGVQKNNLIGSRWRAGFAECEDCALKKLCTNCGEKTGKTRWRTDHAECGDCQKEKPCANEQECVGFEKNGKPNKRGDPGVRFCRDCRAKSQGDCPFQLLGCNDIRGMRGPQKLPSCVECGTSRRFCSREGCANDAGKGFGECNSCRGKKGKKNDYIRCKHDGCKTTVFLWKGLKKAHWLTKDQLLAKRQLCIQHLVEHLIEEEHVAETRGSTSGVDNDDDTSNANNNTEAARAEQADIWLRDSCWNEAVRTSINDKVTQDGADVALAVALSTIEGMWVKEKPEGEEYAEIVTHFVTLLALREDHSFPAELQQTIHRSAKWLQKIYVEVLAENKKLTLIVAMCKTG